MPTYQYRCKDCDNDFEIFQSFSDDALTVCDKCGGNLRKVFGNVGITFKGSGFYKNDSKGSKTSSSGGSSSGGGSDGSSSGSSEGSSSTPSSGDASKSSSDSGGGHSHSHAHGPGTHTH